MITDYLLTLKRKVLTSYKEHLLAISITLITFIIMLLEPESSEWLRYQSIEVSQGQWWRIFTANLCHSNWNHWALNIIGFWIMDWFYQPVLNAKLRAYLLLFCMIANVFLLHLLLDLYWYVGLSGALHGYLIGGALLSWNSAKKLNLAIVVVVSIKLIAESLWQINLATEQLIDANVVEEAHSLGALSAVLFALVIWISKKNR